MKKRIAVFASGAGSNAQEIIKCFKRDPNAEVSLVVTNNSNAGVLKIAAENGIEARVFPAAEFRTGTLIIDALRKSGIDFIALAGFLLKVPASLVHQYRGKMVNIHPALLPKYGGKGMYGHFVHEAVFSSGEKESGITVHWVNENYDEGDIIFQAKVSLDQDDNPQTIEQKVRRLEIEHYAAVIQKLVARQNH